ncbi:MAG: DUF4125 family protein [Oscillospiraceae bacterium]|nr:DUF4125 family protein [Oscillospiraceae bacterium]
MAAKSSNASTIEKILSIEWDMFTCVNEGKSRAACQDDPVTFMGMRRAQFEAWPSDIAESYLSDLHQALLCGRNLAQEKYIHMMDLTDPVKSFALLATIDIPSSGAYTLSREITSILLEQMSKLYEAHPHLQGTGRPLYSVSDFDGFGAQTSLETYQLGELLTYSMNTLTALNKYLLTEEGRTFSERILKNTVKFYGYNSLDEADKAAERMAQKYDRIL